MVGKEKKIEKEKINELVKMKEKRGKKKKGEKKKLMPV